MYIKYKEPCYLLSELTSDPDPGGKSFSDPCGSETLLSTQNCDKKPTLPAYNGM
jgi:hypothetical protein